MLKQLCMNALNRTSIQSSSQVFLVGQEILKKNILEIKACSLHLSCPNYVTDKKGLGLWQTQKQRKAKRDESTAVILTKLAFDIRNVLYKDTKLNADPKSNPDLAKLIKKAQANKIPSDVIKNIIDKQVQKKEQAKEFNSFTARGLNGTGMVVEAFTPKVNRTQNEIQSIVKKYGFKTSISASDLFEHKGVIDVALPEEERSVIKADPSKFDLDKYVDFAIESGAEIEDVKLITGIDSPFLQFECSPSLVDTIHAVFDEAGLVILSSEAIYLPTSSVPVEKEFLEHVAVSEDRLSQMPGFHAMYCNVDLKES